MKDLATETKAEVYYVPQERVDDVFDEVKEMLGKAVATLDWAYGIEDVYRGLINGDGLLWIVLIDGKITAALVTRVMQYPRTRTLLIEWTSGSRMKDWLWIAVEAFTHYAKRNGCTHIEGCGTVGWERWMRRSGLKRNHISYRMEI